MGQSISANPNIEQLLRREILIEFSLPYPFILKTDALLDNQKYLDVMLDLSGDHA
jgi:hypothetical protein